MPFLRVVRDKRGYETTYLVHLFRDGNRQRSRVLYVFRTPGDVRVGRPSLDPETLKEIEAHFPDIDFDWNAVIGNKQVVEPVVDLRRPRRRPQEGEAVEALPPDRPAAEVGPATPAPVKEGDRAEAPAPPRPPVPASIEGETPDEKVAFLAHWYNVCRERILQRASDSDRNEGLLALAERLNPAAWTDADQITSGLEQAAEALERLAHVFGKRRRRSRRGSRRPEAALHSDSGAVSSAEGISEMEIVAVEPITVEAERPPEPTES